MPPGPVPTPVPLFSSGILHAGDYINHYIDESLQWLGVMTPPADSWRHLAAHYKWSGSTDPADDMYVTFDVSNITAGALDPTWITGDYTTVEGLFDTFFTAIASNQANTIALTEYRWYVRSYNPYSIAKPFAPHGPPERVTVKNILGTLAGAQQAPQVAISVTEKTPFPRNWGRFYIPALAGTPMTGAPPRIGSSIVDAIATATNTLLTGLIAANFQIVVPITSLGVGGRGTPGAGTPNRRLANVTKIQVDNVPDVIRRRRPHLATYRKTFP